jgi:hypothetical protein
MLLLLKTTHRYTAHMPGSFLRNFIPQLSEIEAYIGEIKTMVHFLPGHTAVLLSYFGLSSHVALSSQTLSPSF